ncbi:hypothetical protein Tco_0997354 [Tanacetum coccineum]
MSTLNFAQTHNMIAFFQKPAELEGFEQIVDFLNAHPIRYALTVNPTIYVSHITQFWTTAKFKTCNEEKQIHALVDGKKVIVTESSVRRDLQLAYEDGINCLPNPTIFENLALMGYENDSEKLTFYKSIFSPQWKFLIHTILQCLNIVADEAVYKKGDDSLVRATTTASSLEAEQVPRSHGGASAQPRVERVSKLSNDSLLAGGNTPRSDEDNIKLKELMKLCTNLSKRVLDLKDELKKIKTLQQTKIDSLERRVKKLEKKNKLRTHKLKRLFKIVLTARVESSSDGESLDRENASKQGRIHEIDANEDIALVSTHEDVSVHDDKVSTHDEAMQYEEIEVVEEEVVEAITTAKLIAEVVSTAGDDQEVNAVNEPVSVAPTIVTTAQPTEAIKTSVVITTAPKAKGIVIQGQEESTTTIKLISSQPQVKNKDKGKAKMIEPELVKSLKKRTQEQIRMDEELAAELQAEIDEEQRIANEKAQ